MPRKPKSVRVEQDGVRMRLYVVGRSWWADIRAGGRRTRESLRTGERATAETNARALARAIATQQLLGVRPDTLTLGQVFAEYDRHKGAKLDGQWGAGARARARFFTDAWGASTPVVSLSQTSVDSYVSERRRAFADKMAHGAAIKAQREAERIKADAARTTPHIGRPRSVQRTPRSEEHTSELQSQR